MMSTTTVNVNLESIKNLRDLSSALNNSRPNRILRTGCVSKATDEDVNNILPYLLFYLIFHLKLD